MAVVTFSREAHSGTRDLARLLADRLGYRYVSRDALTQAISVASGFERVPVTAESEGRAPSRIEQFGEQLSGNRAAYLASLRAVITDLAIEDNVVLVGHAAGLVLTDMRSVVRLFVVAPLEDRIRRLVAEGATADEAARLIELDDRESAQYIRYLFGVDWLDAHQWDIVVNSGRADMEAVIEMLAQYIERLERDIGEHANLSRQQLVSRLEHALLADDDLGVARVRVVLDGDRVVLEGEALAFEDRERAAALARQLAPELELDNRIVVHPPNAL